MMRAGSTRPAHLVFALEGGDQNRLAQDLAIQLLQRAVFACRAVQNPVHNAMPPEASSAFTT